MGNLLGRNIQYLRTVKKLTLSDLSKIAKVTISAISKWERGETTPSDDHQVFLSNWGGVSIDDLNNTDVRKLIKPHLEIGTRSPETLTATELKLRRKMEENRFISETERRFAELVFALVRKYKIGSVTEFQREHLGYKGTTINAIINGHLPVNHKLVKKIAMMYPESNLKYVYEGIGDPLLTEEDIEESQPKSQLDRIEEKLDELLSFIQST